MSIWKPVAPIIPASSPTWAPSAFSTTPDSFFLALLLSDTALLSRKIIGLGKALHYRCVLNLVRLRIPLCVLPFFPWPFMLAREYRALDDATAGFDWCACRSISVGAGYSRTESGFRRYTNPVIVQFLRNTHGCCGPSRVRARTFWGIYLIYGVFQGRHLSHCQAGCPTLCWGGI